MMNGDGTGRTPKCAGALAAMMTLAMLPMLGSCAGVGGIGSPVATQTQLDEVRYSRDADVRNYRDDLDREAARTGNDFLKTIIADDVVTAEEMDEVYRRTQQCYADAGYKYTALQTGGAQVDRLDGKSPSGDPRGANDVAISCEEKTGFGAIQRIYTNAVRNPDNIKDLSPYVVQCFIDHGLVDPSYTVADYQRDSASRSGPYKILDQEGPQSGKGKQVYECGIDPLGRMG